MLESIIASFQSRYGVQLGPQLGSGKDGTVLAINPTTAAKFFTSAESFFRERDAYVVLATLGIHSVAGHAVPEMIRFDEELKVLEMTIVRPPFLLDFASAYLLDEAPDFTDDAWDQWRVQKLEEFGDRWPEVQGVLAEFTRLSGMVLLDVNPGNIRFAEE
jgi:hypothetical protein